MRQRIAVLGSTGSVGCTTLEVLRLHPDSWQVQALTACRSVDVMVEQCRAFRPAIAVMQDPASAELLEHKLRAHALDIDVLAGDEAIVQVATDDRVDAVMAAIVGAAGLPPVLAAARSGKRLMIANKEPLVMTGGLLLDAARASGSVLLPVDSEHSAIHQCLPVSSAGIDMAGVESLLLTGSGGPFRTSSQQALSVVTKQQALRHPNWSMGPKISIDSATLMNKGLEVIEACNLFGIELEQLEVVIHPESVIHSMVRYVDGTVMAQLGTPDMRTPIAYALGWPERIAAGVQPLDLLALAGLHFEPPDTQRFPCLGLAYAAQRAGGTAPAILNAANEVAVEAFLSEEVAFLQLPVIIERVLGAAKISPASELDTIIEADKDARRMAHDTIAGLV